jgi:hypothetical protein
MIAARTHVALVHHPVLDKAGQVVTTAVTNLDIHDIARAARTFGLAGYFVVTPIAAQRELVENIIGHWTRGAGRAHNDKRTDALSLVRVVASLEEAIAALDAPFVVATGARPRAGVVSCRQLHEVTADHPNRANCIVFGTGWGLADAVFARADAVLAPLRGPPNGGDEYNHLSVRSAVAIVLDRLFGNRETV